MKFCRITKNNDYKKIFSEKKWLVSDSKAFSINYSFVDNGAFIKEFEKSQKNSDFNNAFVGIIASKKVSKKAVERNKIKRQFREIASKNVELIEGVKIVIVARQVALTLPYQQLDSEFVQVMKKIKSSKK